MTIVGAFMGGGSKTVPAGKCLAHLSINTKDRQNLSTASWTITATGKSYTAQADASGRADILVDSGVTYTVALTHQGVYYNDGPQTFVADSTGVVWIYFDLFMYPDVTLFRGTFTGDGTTKTFTLTHGIGAMPAVTLYKGSALMITDTEVTTTTVKFTFNTAPASGTTFTAVLIG